MKNIIKCSTSFLIGAYLSFVLTLSITGYIIINRFVSKDIIEYSHTYKDRSFKTITIKERFKWDGKENQK